MLEASGEADGEADLSLPGLLHETSALYPGWAVVSRAGSEVFLFLFFFDAEAGNMIEEVGSRVLGMEMTVYQNYLKGNWVISVLFLDSGVTTATSHHFPVETGKVD